MAYRLQNGAHPLVDALVAVRHGVLRDRTAVRANDM
jgi:hypothetical protein